MSKRNVSLIAAGYFLLTVILLTLPGTAFPEETFLTKIQFDKWVHTGMFMLLVIIGNYRLSLEKGLQPGINKLFIIVALVALLYGIGIEFVQKYFVRNRSFDLGDIIADAVGCSAGLFVSRYLHKKIDPCGNRGRNQN